MRKNLRWHGCDVLAAAMQIGAGKVVEVLTLGRSALARYQQDDALPAAHRRLLRDTFALLAYPDPKTAPMAYLTTGEHRDKVARVVNSVMLRHSMRQRAGMHHGEGLGVDNGMGDEAGPSQERASAGVLQLDCLDSVRLRFLGSCISHAHGALMQQCAYGTVQPSRCATSRCMLWLQGNKQSCQRLLGAAVECLREEGPGTDDEAGYPGPPARPATSQNVPAKKAIEDDVVFSQLELHLSQLEIVFQELKESGDGLGAPVTVAAEVAGLGD
jgi:hypothetical protein